ncbi:hypothetical protein VNO80_25025 [Phaseolus coccineus]|uniref:RRM domain-containing protein n=1 Tax=Phaseolus coccineus TaxID=3886 RepID=A0AAN9LYD0_PHACN
MADTSFFFTNFPDYFFEKDLWMVFQRWGRVLDVFISSKLNSRNRRFRFVRFQRVEDVYELEKKLVAIWIGTWKLQVNLPKYNRFEQFGKRGKYNRLSERATMKRGERLSFTGRVREQLQLKNRVSQPTSGCLLEASNMQLVKESFVLGGFGVVRLRHCFESVDALVGKVVKVDQATLAREVLEYVCLRVSIPVGVLPSMKREMSIDGLSCLVVFDMETCTPDHKLRIFFSKWGDVSVPESVASLEDDGGKECVDSVSSHSGDKNGSAGGEELTVRRRARILRSGEKHAACHYGNHDGEVKLDKEVEHVHRDPRIRVSHATCLYGNDGGELNAHEGQGTFNGKVERSFEDWRGDAEVARPVDGDGHDRLGVKGFVTFSSIAHESGAGGVSMEKEALVMEVDGRAMADRVGGVVKVGMGRAEYSRWNGGPESIVGDSQITRMEKVKDLACFLEANVGNGTLSLADREVDDYKMKGIEETSSPFEESNLIEVRVVQANYSVLQPTLISTPIFFCPIVQ